MQNIANALAIATPYIELRSDVQSYDDDIKALEAIAAELQAATEDEKRAFKSAFEAIGSLEILEVLGIE